MKYTALVLLLILFFSIAHPAEAAICQHYNGHQICILSIQRSAKNHWEYRAAVSVDGVTKPTQVYNCRDRATIQLDGTQTLFKGKDTGEFICRFFQRRHN